MRPNIYLPVVAVWLLISCTAAAEQAPRETPKATHSDVNADAGVIAEFKKKVDAYNDLRSELQRKAPPLKRTDDPGEIALAEKALAQQIRAARANAKRGEIFTPATAAMFRRMLRPTVKGSEGAENKAIIKDDAPGATEVPFKINGEYPKDAPLSTVPPDMLKTLPPLPENLQYRFVGKHLILYCIRGNLIVDYMVNAIP